MRSRYVPQGIFVPWHSRFRWRMPQLAELWCCIVECSLWSWQLLLNILCVLSETLNPHEQFCSLWLFIVGNIFSKIHDPFYLFDKLLFISYMYICYFAVYLQAVSPVVCSKLKIISCKMSLVFPSAISLVKSRYVRQILLFHGMLKLFLFTDYWKTTSISNKNNGRENIHSCLTLGNSAKSW